MAAVVDRARSCVVVRDREWSCAAVVRGHVRRSCAVVRGHARRSCVVVRGGRAWSCAAVVRGRVRRSCVVMRGGRAWSCAAVVRGGRAWRSCGAVVRGGRAWSFVVVRGRARSCVVVRGSAWSCVVVTHCRAAHFAASTAVTHGRTDGHTESGRTTYNTPLNPPGVGWVNFFYPIKVRVSIRTCVPNLGSIRGSVRKNWLLSLIIDLIITLTHRMWSCVVVRVRAWSYVVVRMCEYIFRCIDRPQTKVERTY